MGKEEGLSRGSRVTDLVAVATIPLANRPRDSWIGRRGCVSARALGGVHVHRREPALHGQHDVEPTG